MNHKLILSIFAVLLLLGMIPFSFTATPEPYIFGWLPLPLLYWWVLMGINLIFVLWVANSFVKNAKEEDK
ncbi:MAG: hypothetical protein RIN55_08500 [Tissierellaceae bacterium]|nr:hypothetical protein [Tissierellaceae bacterium]